MIVVFLLPENGFSQCTNVCEIDFQNDGTFYNPSPFEDVTSGTDIDIVAGASGPTLTGFMSDVFDPSSTSCAYATGNGNDFTIDFEIEPYFDVYTGATTAPSVLNPGTGNDTNSNGRFIVHDGTGFKGQNSTNDGTVNGTSTGDVSCYNISVCFTSPQQAQNVTVNTTSINTAGESYESASVIFLDASCNPYGTAVYNGFWATDPLGSNGGTNTTTPNNAGGSTTSGSIYTTTGTGVFVAADIETVDITDPYNPIAAMSSTTNNSDPNASTDAGLAPTALVGGFVYRVCLEDIAVTDNENEETTANTSFTSTLNGFNICLDICPDGLADATAPVAIVTSESTCAADGTTLSGGVIAAPATSCPTGSTLEYSVVSGTTWSTTLPVYDQATAVTVMTRCVCDNDADVISMEGSVTTVPASCPPPVVCTLPELVAFATCTDDATGDEASQDMYYIQLDINSLGSDTDGDNEVTVSVDGTPTTYTATGSYFIGPFSHSGTGTVTTAISYSNDGEDCIGDITLSETLCGYRTDADGTSDDTADDDLHASGPSCDCDEAMPGSVLAQVAPGSFDPATSIMVYILVDGTGRIVTSNNTGLFAGLADDTYTVYPYNVDLTEVASFMPVVGSDYADFMPDNGTCNFGCGSAVMTLDCDCRMDDVAIRKVLSSVGPFKVGDKVTFTINAYNQGTDPIYNVAVLDYLPAALDFFAADNIGNDFAGNPNTAGNGTVTATVATTTPLAPGANYSLTIVLTVNSNATAGGSIVNYAEIIGATEDEDGDFPIDDEDDPLTDMGGGTGEDDDNINDDSGGSTDALADQDDFDMALLNLCPGLSATVDSPTVCKGTTSAPINLVVTEGMVEHMQIFYDPAADAAGFEDVVPLVNPYPTNYVIPDGLTEGVYTGVIVLRDAALCSTSIPFTITIECPNCGSFPWDGSK